MSEADFTLAEHLAMLADEHGIEWDDDDVQTIESAAQAGGFGPAETEEFVANYARDVYGDDDDELSPAELRDVAEQAGRKLIGRPLTTTELQRLSDEVGTDVSGATLHAAAERLALKPVEDMSREEHNR